MPLSLELAVAEDLARRAGAILLTSKRQLLYEKANEQGPVTQADLDASALICEGLRQHFPSDVIISEEMAKDTDPKRSADQRIWFIDPMDGTTDFIRGGDEFSVMIGLVVQGKPILGVVFQPTRSTVWRAVCLDPSGPATCFAERVVGPAGSPPIPMTIGGRSVPEGGPVVILSRNHSSKATDLVASRLHPSHIVRMGSVGLKVAAVVDGLADIFVSGSRRIKLWDTAAPEAIIKGAGGVLLKVDGQPIDYLGEYRIGFALYAATPQGATIVKRSGCH
jgi:3'(2'), 5'-bisphosphate nucleotidase